jgi:hypothetical protein
VIPVAPAGSRPVRQVAQTRHYWMVQRGDRMTLMGEEPARPLSPDEQRVLAVLLDNDLPGAAELRDQVPLAKGQEGSHVNCWLSGKTESGWADLNRRPPRPERGALTKLRYSPSERRLSPARGSLFSIVWATTFATRRRSISATRNSQPPTSRRSPSSGMWPKASKR